MMYDVAIIGGGPAGSTAATLLAGAGLQVLVLEREIFPRFHIGESLLPANLPIFERLGVTFAAGAAHVRKSGAEFYDEAEGKKATYLFGESLGDLPRHSYQVDRASFDQALLERSIEVGATVHQGERVTDVDLGAEGVVVHTDKGRYDTRYLIDATGLDSFLGYKHKTRKRIDAFGLGAVYGHFVDLSPEIVDELLTHGNVKILFVEDGWLWGIPLGGGRLSVGLVTRRKGIKRAWLDEAIAASPELSRVLAGARAQGPHVTIGSFSFHNERPHGSRFCCVGDAACFLDPVFSSGVALAMVGAERSADRLIEAFAEGCEAEPGLMGEHGARMAEGYSIFATLILALYQRRLLPNLFFAREQDPELRAGMTSILAGDVWRADNLFQEQLWRSVRRRFVIPAPEAAG